jgi:hypothetical protein
MTWRILGSVRGNQPCTAHDFVVHHEGTFHFTYALRLKCVHHSHVEPFLKRLQKLLNITISGAGNSMTVEAYVNPASLNTIVYYIRMKGNLSKYIKVYDAGWQPWAPAPPVGS